MRKLEVTHAAKLLWEIFYCYAFMIFIFIAAYLESKIVFVAYTDWHLAFQDLNL